jgi:hypothetical protein
MASETLKVLVNLAALDFEKTLSFNGRLLGQRLMRRPFGQFDWVFSIVVLIDFLRKIGEPHDVLLAFVAALALFVDQVGVLSIVFLKNLIRLCLRDLINVGLS